MIMFKPRGKYLRAYEVGKQAYTNGKEFSDNPNLNAPNRLMSSWWEKGYIDAKTIDNDNKFC